jgi:hypothetical protein
VTNLRIKGHLGMYFTKTGGKEFQKNLASEIALIGQKVISFSTMFITM